MWGRINMKNKSIALGYMFLKGMIREKTIIFSVFILPIVTIWSTWWITADMPMEFSLVSGLKVLANMIDIHILTGGLTAVALTAGIFSFLIASDNSRLNERLRLMGYKSLTINFAMFLSTLTVLVTSFIVALGLTIYFYLPKHWLGVAEAMLLTVLIYALMGNLLATFYPRPVEGTFIILLISFLDTMLLSNPMASGVYLQEWTYYLPAFWPTQLVLEAGFVGSTSNLVMYSMYSVIYLIVLLLIVQISKIFIKG
jgi:hypothetical protein